MTTENTKDSKQPTPPALASVNGYAPISETFTLLCCDDDELQAMHICTLAIERHIGHDPEAKHRVAEYIKNRYGA